MYGLDRPPQSQGRLLRRPLLQQAQPAHRAVGLPQLVNEGGNVRRLALGDGHLLCGRRQPGRHGLVTRQDRAPVPGALQVVLGLIGGDAAQPLPLIAFWDGLPVEVGGEEGLLGQVLRRGGVPDQLETDGVHQPLIPAHQL